MDTDKTIQAKIDKPHEFFNEPLEVVIDPGLSKDQKKEALDSLEQDARQMATAAAEGMTGGEPTKLHEVLDAKDSLDLHPTAVAYSLVQKDLHAQRSAAEGGPARAAAEHALVALDAAAKAGAAPVVTAAHGATADDIPIAGSTQEAETERAMEALDP